MKTKDKRGSNKVYIKDKKIIRYFLKNLTLAKNKDMDA